MVLASRLYWAVPFVPYIWERIGGARGFFMRVGFEASYTINVVTKLLTLPLRPYLPGFYIIGFPVSAQIIPAAKESTQSFFGT